MKKIFRNKFVFIALLVLYIPFYYLGYVLYLISKVLNAGSQTLMGNMSSAKNALESFWSVEVTGYDIFD